jgi:hypothetical protein
LIVFLNLVAVLKSLGSTDVLYHGTFYAHQLNPFVMDNKNCNNNQNNWSDADDTKPTTNWMSWSSGYKLYIWVQISDQRPAILKETSRFSSVPPSKC